MLAGSSAGAGCAPGQRGVSSPQRDIRANSIPAEGAVGAGYDAPLRMNPGKPLRVKEKCKVVAGDLLYCRSRVRAWVWTGTRCTHSHTSFGKQREMDAPSMLLHC
jgi:hypothetical protein